MTLLILFILMLIFAPWMLGIVLMIPVMMLGLVFTIITSPVFWMILLVVVILNLLFN